MTVEFFQSEKTVFAGKWPFSRDVIARHVVKSCNASEEVASISGVEMDRARPRIGSGPGPGPSIGPHFKIINSTTKYNYIYIFYTTKLRIYDIDIQSNCFLFSNKKFKLIIRNE